MALNVQDSWAALVKAATAYTSKNKVKTGWAYLRPESSPSPPTPKEGDFLGLGLGKELNKLTSGIGKSLKQLSYDRLPDNFKNSPQGKALAAEIQNESLGNNIATSFAAYMAAKRNQAHMERGLIPSERGLIPSPAPQPSESQGQLKVSQGQLKVDLDTSPVQTKDSVMYRNAGDGEESTIGEASRPNKRKPGLSSNLGINL